MIFVGGSAREDQQWEWISEEKVKDTLWGPGQPYGDGECGSFVRGKEWDPMLPGYSWKLNDEPCSNRHAFVCQMNKCKHKYYIYIYI
jgi:hypothetical protein